MMMLYNVWYVAYAIGHLGICSIQAYFTCYITYVTNHVMWRFSNLLQPPCLLNLLG